MEARLVEAIHWVTRLLEVAGLVTIVLGAGAATIVYLLDLRGRTGGKDPFSRYRSNLGRAILLALEFLVAADIVNTVAIDPTLDSLAVLAGIVAIRTFLSFSLEVELEGRWPWRRAAGEEDAA
jgi:uncharacterized membrane protein